MELDNLSRGAVILAVCTPMFLGIIIGVFIIIMRYVSLRNSHYNNSDKWEIASLNAFSTGFTISFWVTAIVALIVLIVYNWNTPL